MAKTTTSFTQSVVPQQWTKFATDTMAMQQAQSAQPFQGYNKPRVAGLTPAEQQAAQMTRAGATGYEPMLTQAMTTAKAYDPMFALRAASPLLQAASGSSVEGLDQYMNPYMTGVLERFGKQGLRTLNEQILPGISDAMVRAGQFGGSRQAELFGRGVRDVTESILDKQAELLSSGWEKATGLKAADLARMGALAGTTADIYGNAGQQQLAQTSLLAQLAGQQQQQALAGAGALRETGALERDIAQRNLDVAYQEEMRRQGYTQAQIDALARTAGALSPFIPQGQYKVESSKGSAPVSGMNTFLGTATTLGGLASNK